MSATGRGADRPLPGSLVARRARRARGRARRRDRPQQHEQDEREDGSGIAQHQAEGRDVLEAARGAGAPHLRAGEMADNYPNHPDHKADGEWQPV